MIGDRDFRRVPPRLGSKHMKGVFRWSHFLTPKIDFSEKVDFHQFLVKFRHSETSKNDDFSQILIKNINFLTFFVSKKDQKVTIFLNFWSKWSFSGQCSNPFGTKTLNLGENAREMPGENAL